MDKNAFVNGGRDLSPDVDYHRFIRSEEQRRTLDTSEIMKQRVRELAEHARQGKSKLIKELKPLQAEILISDPHHAENADLYTDLRRVFTPEIVTGTDRRVLMDMVSVYFGQESMSECELVPEEAVKDGTVENT
jgi:hypothetical protein